MTLRKAFLFPVAATTKRIAIKTTTKCVQSMCIVMEQSETNDAFIDKPVKRNGVKTSVLLGEEGAWKIGNLDWSSHK